MKSIMPTKHLKAKIRKGEAVKVCKMFNDEQLILSLVYSWLRPTSSSSLKYIIQTEDK